MEERLQQTSEWDSGSSPPSNDTSASTSASNSGDVTAISKLANQVEEQVIFRFYLL